MVLVSRLPLRPFSSTTLTQSSRLASGLSPVPDGLMSLVAGKYNGNSSSGTSVVSPSSQ